MIVEKWLNMLENNQKKKQKNITLSYLSIEHMLSNTFATIIRFELFALQKKTKYKPKCKECVRGAICKNWPPVEFKLPTNRGSILP